MKSLLLALATLSFPALAANTITTPGTEIGRTTLTCRAGTGEAANSLKLIDTPHGYIAEASASWLGGTHKSGQVPVELTEAPDDGPTYLSNLSLGFSVTVHTLSVSADGRTKTAKISGSFKDPKTGQTGQLISQVFTCN